VDAPAPIVMDKNGYPLSAGKRAVARPPLNNVISPQPKKPASRVRQVYYPL
jgi:hypothetical protein